MTMHLAAAFVVMLVLAICDVFWPLSVAVVLALAVGWWLGHASTLWALWRPEWIAVYVAVGFAWMFFRWTRFVEREWQRRKSDKYVARPVWSQHSWEYSAYFFYWPVDVVAYTLSDLLRDAWEWIANMVSRSFDRYAAYRFGEDRDV